MWRLPSHADHPVRPILAGRVQVQDYTNITIQNLDSSNHSFQLLDIDGTIKGTSAIICCGATTRYDPPLSYQCGVHGSMKGNVLVTRPLPSGN